MIRPVLLAVTLSLLPAKAQVPPGSVTADLFAGRLYGGYLPAGSNLAFAGPAAVDDDILKGFSLGFQWNRRWAAELSVRRATSTLVPQAVGLFPSQPALATLDFAVIEAAALRTFQHGHLQPYLSLGAAVVNLDPNLADPAVRDGNRPGLSAGAGARFWFRPWLALRFDVRARFVDLGRGWLRTQEAVAGVTLCRRVGQ